MDFTAQRWSHPGTEVDVQVGVAQVQSCDVEWGHTRGEIDAWL
jgi:hypothetical protein